MTNNTVNANSLLFDQPPPGVSIIPVEEMMRLEARFIKRGGRPFHPNATTLQFTQIRGWQGWMLLLGIGCFLIFIGSLMRDADVLWMPGILAPILLGFWVYSKYRRVTIVVEPGRLRRQDSLGPFALQSTYERSVMAGVACRSNRGQGMDAAKILLLVFTDRKEIPLLSSFRSSTMAEWFAVQLHHAYGLPVRGVSPEESALFVPPGNVGFASVIVDESAGGAAQNVTAPKPFGFRYPPEPCKWFDVFLPGTERFTWIARRLPPCLSPPHETSFAIRQRYCPFLMVIILVAWAMGMGYAGMHRLGAKWWPPQELLKNGNGWGIAFSLILVTAFGVAAVYALGLWFGKSWLVFLSDGVVKFREYFGVGRAVGFARKEIREVKPEEDASLGNNRNNLNTSVALRMENEEDKYLLDIIGFDAAAWVRNVIQEWLDKSAATKGRTAERERGLRWERPPKGLAIPTGEKRAALEASFTAAGQEPFHCDAVVVQGGMSKVVVLISGFAMLFWLCGCYGALFNRIILLAREGVGGNVGTLAVIPLLALLGLLPIRVLGRALLSRLTLVVEPGQIRMHRSYLGFGRVGVFPAGTLRGHNLGTRWLDAVTTLELVPTSGKPIILLESNEESPPMRWIARALESVAGLRQTVNDAARVVMPEDDVDLGFPKEWKDAPPKGK